MRLIQYYEDYGWEIQPIDQFHETLKNLIQILKS
jgi:hypothetical protein